jgi:flavin reductase (DIM6/NTAB) family NADH-FMN oxidoreductase RutF
MFIEFENLSANNRYHLLTQTIIPRPVAWVLSENDDKSLNLAPFSFFNAMCSDPPLLVLSIGKKPDGELKDTRRNLTSGRDFVVHIAGVDDAEALNASAAVLDYGDSELSKSDLALSEFPQCSVPRLSSCDIAYQCRFYEEHLLGPNQQAILYVEVLQLYLSDSVVVLDNNRYTVNAEKISPLSRLGGSQYMQFGKAFSLVRPK